MKKLVDLILHPTGVAEIIVDRPERHNAMTLPMYQDVLAFVERCAQDPGVGAILFRGTGGKSFIAGTDISYFKDFTSGKQGLEYEAFVERVVGAVERIAVPTIAVIDGWTVGGGLALATVCDFRLCTDSSRFGVPIAKTLSNTLSSLNLARLTAGFGLPRVKKMLLLADYISADEALSCGYAYQVCPREELESTAHALAVKLIGLSSVTQQAAKESLRRITVEQNLSDEDLIESVYGSQAFRDGVAAFISPKK
ncbi:MAG: enoyl-CoA hydratase [Burkholderiaceae bacterium]